MCAANHDALDADERKAFRESVENFSTLYEGVREKITARVEACSPLAQLNACFHQRFKRWETDPEFANSVRCMSRTGQSKATVVSGYMFLHIAYDMPICIGKMLEGKSGDERANLAQEYRNLQDLFEESLQSAAASGLLGWPGRFFSALSRVFSAATRSAVLWVIALRNEAWIHGQTFVDQGKDGFLTEEKLRTAVESSISEATARPWYSAIPFGLGPIETLTPDFAWSFFDFSSIPSEIVALCFWNRLWKQLSVNLDEVDAEDSK